MAAAAIAPAAAATTFDFCDVAKGKHAARQKLLPCAWLASEEQIERAKEASKQENGRDWPLHVGAIVLSKEEQEITQTAPRTLLERMWDQRRWTAAQVTEAFCKRATLAQQALNCLTEICFDQALQRAKELDDEFAKTSERPKGSLAGVPISIKDNFNIKGLDSTLGFVAWANKPVAYDALLIECLRDQGAILYCKTNVPTAMMIPETLNNTWGRTLNPRNVECTPGGSSGGEGALIAMHGSPLGVGTDIGGSIRIPGALCGLYSLKPSLGRFPTFGARSAMSGQESVHSINGPLANDLDALHLFAESVVGWKPWRFDPKCVPIPWTPVSLPAKGLVFGMLIDNRCVAPEPPLQRALEHVQEQLERAGHTVLPWHVDDGKDNIFATSVEILSDMFGADGREAILQLAKEGNEDDRWVPGLPKPKEALSVSETWQVQSKRWTLGNKICKQWESMQDVHGRTMDALIMPAAPHAAVRHDHFAPHVIYTGIWNLVDFPASTLPLPAPHFHADAKLDGAKKREHFHSSVDQHVWQSYDERLADGMPVCVQVVGRRLEEERLLASVKRIEDALLQQQQQRGRQAE